MTTTNPAEFVIRMKNGFFYESMGENRRPMVCAMLRNAHRFPSRMAALQVCGLTHEFSGARIQSLDEVQDAPPSPQEAA